MKKLIRKITMLYKIRLIVSFLSGFNSKYSNNYSYLELWSMFIRGFIPETWTILNITKDNSNQYLSDFRRIVLPPNFERSDSHILDNKSKFNEFMSCYPQLKNKAVEEMETNKKYVIKPIKGLKGKGILFVTPTTHGYYINNRLVKTLPDLSNSIIVPFIQQEHFLESIYKTPNTVRVVTVKDPSSGLCHMHSALLRMGTKASYPIDNYSQGGCIAPINKETGEIGVVNYVKDYFLCTGVHHPDSRVKVTGNKIKNWSDINSEIIKVAESFDTTLIGWDIIVTEDGFKIIEGNNKADMTVTQIGAPIYSNPITSKLLR